MVKPVAFLDVDHTLSFTDPNSDDGGTIYNEGLIKALLKKGIKDVYLFTDMTFSPHSIRDRRELVQLLQKKGFTVHGVLTPCDIMWSQLTGDQAVQINKALLQRKLSKYSGAPFEKVITDEPFTIEYPFVTELRHYSPQKNQPGCSYDEANKVFDPNAPSLPAHLETRSTMTKVFSDFLAEKTGYVDLSKEPGHQQGHTKSLMLDFFLHHKPDWISSILVVDDNINVIQGIGTYKETRNPKLPIGTLQIEQMESEEVYGAAIDEHLKTDPHFGVYYKLQQLIDDHIKHLNSSWFNPFLSSPQAKIEALELLKEELLNAFSTTEEVAIPTLIDNWQNAIKFKSVSTNASVPISTVISQHRNLFFTEHRDKLTSTQLFIEQLKVQFKPQNGKEEVLIVNPLHSIN